MKLFELKNLSFAYDKEPVLENINLSYDDQDFLAIMGPNGGGKTTLIKLILGLISSKNDIKKYIDTQLISYVPQTTQANENFPIRVLELVLMGLVNQKFFHFYDKKDKIKALETLDKVGIKDLWDKKLNDLSGGQRQRVFIARALMSKCKLLILDEPTASVDAKTSVQIFELLNTLHEESIGIITICHDINIVLAYANKIAYLNKELFLHDNTAQNTKFIKHLYENHQHFCGVEMSLKTCFCIQDEAKY
ncbi:metal ABC transporter ATP-binding protein [Campylobacter sp. MIT 99-7217]|uniref:metal ABC transporter ATP-binding protein n=1 Tax=Campylobacter sp. MIT 99-7217 TaxID=535091 RepID=UPI001157B143|nr:ABC transporter ATP-binding protein [Campylobacter sp. MIT 99-7217]TQR29198.1 metal ABC transporter ATP-binding protein [Campylobacter sp. MIT 99-7217]